MAAQVDPFLVEFLVNFRWVLCVVERRLDPVREQQYPQLLADADAMGSVLSSSSWASLSTLAAVPFGVLEMAKSGLYYLLAAERVLEECPPTMHPFLQRVTGAQAWDSKSSRSRTRPTDAAHMNVSNATTSSTVDTRTAGSVNAREYEDGQGGQPTGCQAMVLLLRWLVRGGILPPEELALTLALLTESHGAGRGGPALLSEELGKRGGNNSPPGRQGASLFTSDDVSSRSSRSSSAGRHPCRVSYRRASKRLSQLSPFYLGAHLLITRCLLMHYTCTLLPTQSIHAHVDTLRHSPRAPRAAVRGRDGEENDTLEKALVRWLRQVTAGGVDGTVEAATGNGSRTSGRNVSVASTLSSPPARNQWARPHAPRHETTWDGHEGRAWLAQFFLKEDLYEITSDGAALGLACHFYKPHMVPLHAVRPAAFLDGSSVPSAPHGLAASTTVAVRNWAAVLRCAEALGLFPCLTAEELARHGAGSLQLHLLRFTEELFAVLATEAEEEMRASLDLGKEDEVWASEGEDLASMREGNDDLTDVESNPGRGHDDTHAHAEDDEQCLPKRPSPVKPSSPIVAQKKKTQGSSITVPDAGANDTEVFPSPSRVCDTDDSFEPFTEMRVHRGAGAGVFFAQPIESSADDSTGGHAHNEGEGPKAEEENTQEDDTSPQRQLTPLAVRRRILVFPESPPAAADEVAPRKEPLSPDRPTHATTADGPAEVPTDCSQGPSWADLQQPLFTSSSTAAGVLVSKTTVDATSRVLQDERRRVEDNDLVETDSDAGGAQPSSGTPTRDDNEGRRPSSPLTPPSSVEAVSANVSAAEEDKEVTVLERTGSHCNAALEEGPEAQLMALLAEQELHAGEHPEQRAKISITSSMSIPVDVPDTAEDPTTNGTSDEPGKGMARSREAVNAAASWGDSVSSPPQSDSFHLMERVSKRSDPPDARHRSVAPWRKASGKAAATSKATGSTTREAAPPPAARHPRVAEPEESVAAESARTSATAIRKWTWQSSSSSEKDCGTGKNTEAAAKPSEGAGPLHSSSSISSTSTTSDASSQGCGGQEEERADKGPASREKDASSTLAATEETRRDGTRSPRTPESASGQSPITPGSNAGASSFLPVEASPFPSVFSAGSRAAHEDAESYFSSVSHDRHGARSHNGDRDLGELLSNLLSQTAGPQLGEGDIKHLLETVAKQQEVIRRVTQQLRRPHSSVSGSGTPRKHRSKGHAGASSPVTTQTPMSGRRRAVSFYSDGSATPPSVLLRGGDATGATQSASETAEAQGQQHTSPPAAMAAVPSDGSGGGSKDPPQRQLLESGVGKTRGARKLHAHHGAFTASMIDRMCGEVATGRPGTQSSIHQSGPLHSVNQTADSLMLSGAVNSSRGSLGGQLAETDVTSTSATLPLDEEWSASNATRSGGTR